MGVNFDINNIKWIKGSYGLPECVYKIKVPSVSQILSSIPDPEYDKWVQEMGQEAVDRIMIAAGNRGSALHVFTETFIETYAKRKDISEALKITQEQSPIILRKDSIPENKIQEGRNLFYKFYYSDYSNQFSDLIAIEMGIYSPSLFYRGKLDIFYKDKIFGLSITDLKSSNGMIKKGSTKELKYKYQLGGYVNAVEEMYQEKNLKINKASILCVDKKSDILQDIQLSGKELEEYKDKFKTLVKNWHINNNSEFLIVNVK